MLLKARYKIISFLAALFILSNLGTCFSAWWDNSYIPAPPETEQLRTQTKVFSGTEFKFTYYTSTQDEKSIKDFYKRELINLGWKEKQILDGLMGDKKEEIKEGSTLDLFFDNNLIYEKDGKMLTVTFLPKEVRQQGRVDYSISIGKPDFEKFKVSPQASPIPKLMAKPQKNVAPVYPGAVLVSLSEKAEYLKAVYYTQDDIEKVMDYYKGKMPSSGWSLVDEVPITKTDYSKATEKLWDLESCPTCQQGKIGFSQIMGEVWFGELSYANQKSDTCKVGFINNAKAEGGKQGYLPGFTAIRVDYEKKK
ncbi:MAG: hypothetical protein PHO70_01115 [Candidatus Omnitrophica bacterium]|nr:hypothetical protein [Candidatus Omnitrophota bacterium]